MRSTPIATFALLCAACVSSGRAPAEPDPSSPNVTPPPPRPPMPALLPPTRSSDVFREPETHDDPAPNRADDPCPPNRFASDETARSRVDGSLPSGLSDAAVGNRSAPFPEGGLLDGLDATTIRNIVVSHLPLVRECWQEGVRRKPGLSGNVTVEFKIDKTGNVSSVTPVCSSMPDPAVVACVVAVFERMLFPPSPALSKVSWPLKFKLPKE